MGLGDFMFGQKEKMQQVPTMNPQQMQMLSQLLGGMTGGSMGGGPMGQGMQYLSGLLSGNPETMQKFEAPFMRQFQEQTVPSLAERFSSMGSGAQGSSAFGQQLGQAGAGLSENLASLRGQLQQGAMSQLQGMMGMGMGARPFENIFRPATQGFMGSMAGGIGSAAGQAGGMYGMSKLLPLLGLV
jgi:hypothetical protein